MGLCKSVSSQFVNGMDLGEMAGHPTFSSVQDEGELLRGFNLNVRAKRTTRSDDLL